VTSKKTIAQQIIMAYSKLFTILKIEVIIF